jgi:hypothetical protein
MCLLTNACVCVRACARVCTRVCAALSSGLKAEYFTNVSAFYVPDFSTLGTPTVVRRESTINYASSNMPWGGLFFNLGFAARFTGYVNITVAGSYTFSVGSTDGARLWLDGALLVDNDGEKAAWTIRSAAVTLAVGLHALEVGALQTIIPSGLVVTVAGPGLGAQPLPASMLVNPSLGYNTAPVVTLTSSPPAWRLASDPVVVRVSTSDAEDGALPLAGVRWLAELRSCNGSNTYPCASSELLRSSGTANVTIPGEVCAVLCA